MRNHPITVIFVLFLCVITAGSIVAAAIFYKQNQDFQNTINSQEKDIQDLQNTVSSLQGTTNSNDVNTKIFFSKDPESNSDFTFTVNSLRKIDKLDPVNTSIAQILSGPDADEKTAGYFNPINLSGDSNCDGKNFVVTSTKDGNEYDTLVKFCKVIVSNGVGDDARIKTVISKTLQGLKDSVGYISKKVIILTKDDNCLGDESGLNQCLK